MEEIRHKGKDSVVLLDKEVLGPGEAHPLRAVGSQAASQPPNDERK